MTALPDTVVQSGPVASPNPVPAQIPIALETAIAAAGGFAGRASSAAEATEALRDEVVVAHDEVIGARTDVIAAKSEAVTARNEAVAARNEAVPAAAAAAAGATTATNKAGEAAGSATLADTRATAAAGSATAAAGAATTATTKAAEAAAAVSALLASISAIVGGGAAASPWWLDGFEPTVLLSAPKGAARLSGAYAADTAILTVSSASKRVVGPTGTLDTVAANALAYDYSSGRRRLLVEAKAATKYGPSSEVIGGANYGLGNVTQGAATAGPDGTNGMREIVENTTSGVAHNWWSTAGNPSAAAAGEYWAHQIIVRRGVGARNVKIRNIGTAYTGAYPEVCVNLGSGAILSSLNVGRVAVVALNIPGIGACWRIEMTATTTQAGTIVHSAYFLSGTASNTDYYAGDGVSSIHFGYVNVEKVGSASEPPSSYVTVPSTAGVPRVADDVRLSTAALAQLALATGATIMLRGGTTYTANGRVLGYQGGALSPILMSNSGSAAVAAYDGVSVITTTASAGGWGAFGVAEAHALGVVRVAVNGGAVATSAAFVAGYFAPTTARFFACGDGTNAVNGFVDELAIWPLVGSAAAVAAQARVYA